MNRFSLAVVVALCLVQAETSANAGSYYVRESGRDENQGRSPDQALRTVQKAIGLARAGDTIHVGKGRYPDFNVQRKSGTRVQPILIVGDLDGSKTGDKGRPVFTGNRRSRYRSVIFLSRAQHIHFSGLAISGGREDGFRISDSRYIQISDCQISGMPDDGILFEQSEGKVDRCNVFKNGGDGFYCTNSTLNVSQCTFDQNRGVGFSTYNSRSTRIRLDISRCRITQNRRQGMNLRYGVGRIHNCLIVRNSGEGIKNWGTFSAIHCTIAFNGNDGVEQESGFIDVANCIISSNSQSGVQIDGGRMGRFNNCIWGNRQGPFTRTRLASNEILEDPKIDQHYRPTTASVGNNRARLISDITIDLDGNTRPQGGQPDMGAFEYVQKQRASVYYLRRNRGDDSNSGETAKDAWRTIQHAFKRLQPGDTLYIGGGSYRADRAGNYLRSGTSSRPIKIIGDTSGDKTGDKGEAHIYGHTWGIGVSRKSDIYFENLSMEGRQGGLSLGFSERIVVHNCRFKGRYYTFSMRGAKATVTQCTFSGGDNASILSDTSFLKLDRCVIGRSRGQGVRVEKTYSVSGPGILEMTRCRIAFCRRNAIYGKRAKISVSDSLITDNGGGVYIYESVVGNTIVSNCTFVRNRAGFYLSGYGGARITNSIMMQCGRAVFHRSRNDVRLSHNLFYGNSQNHVVWSRRLEIRNHGFKVADPLFVSTNDYHLKPDSPAIDQGMDSTSTQDLDGNERPQFAGFDIGCYEASEKGGDDPDPGPGAKVAPLWGINDNDSMLFRIGNYNKPISSLRRFGRLQWQADQYMDSSIQAMTIERAARMFVVYRAPGARVVRNYLGFLNLNRLTDPNQATNGTVVTSNHSRMVVRQIGPIDHPREVCGMAFDPLSKDLYLITKDFYLMSVERNSGRIKWKKQIHFPAPANPNVAVSRVAPKPSDLAFDPDGNLYVADLNYFVMVVDKSTAQVIKVAKKKPKGTWDAMAFDHITGRLIASDSSDRTLYHIRMNKGIHRKLGQTGMSAIKSLTFIPGDGVAGQKLRIVEWRETRETR